MNENIKFEATEVPKTERRLACSAHFSATSEHEKQVGQLNQWPGPDRASTLTHGRSGVTVFLHRGQ